MDGLVWKEGKSNRWIDVRTIDELGWKNGWKDE